MIESGRPWAAGPASRTGRRGLVRGALAAGAVAAAGGLAGCRTGKRTSPAASANTQPRRGGTVTVSANFQQKFDPHVSADSQASLYGLFYQNLVRYNPADFSIEPELAQKWESPSATEIIFTLAPNIRWQDKPPASGRALKVADVVYSLNRARTNDPRFIYRSSLAGVDKLEAVDDRTLRMSLTQPNVYQLGNLAIHGLKILAPEVVEAAKDNLSTPDTVVGTGAFVMQTYELGVGASFVRNPIYYKPGLPYLDRVETRVFSDPQTEWSAFLAGRLDKDDVPGNQAKQIDSQDQSRYTLQWVGDGTGFPHFPNSQRKPFDDARVDRALRLLTDHNEFKSAWAEAWWGRGRFSVMFPAALAAWDLTEDEYAQHLEWKQPKDDAIKEALSLLAATGFTKSNPLRFTIAGGVIPWQDAQRQLLQAQFTRNGQGAVAPDIKGYEEAAWTQVRAKGDFDYLAAGNSPGGFQPDDWFSGIYQTGGSRNYGKMSDPKLDAMFARQRTLFDESERKQAVREIILYAIDNLPGTFPVGLFDLNAIKPEVHAFTPEGSTLWTERYENVWRTS